MIKNPMIVDTNLTPFEESSSSEESSDKEKEMDIVADPYVKPTKVEQNVSIPSSSQAMEVEQMLVGVVNIRLQVIEQTRHQQHNKDEEFEKLFDVLEKHPPSVEENASDALKTMVVVAEQIAKVVEKRPISLIIPEDLSAPPPAT
ncbi:hypothetical protein ACLOJK_023655 [Asimina triloba]